MYALTEELSYRGHHVTVIVPNPDLHAKLTIQSQVLGEHHFDLIQVRSLKTKDISYIARTVAEVVNPFLIAHRLRKNTAFMSSKIDGVVWYSPTIFWGPFIRFIKQHFGCPSYLVLRDFFPDWAAHLGLLSPRGLPFWFFKKMELYQYRQADTIGIQSPNNLQYFERHYPQVKSRLEVLWNWGFSDAHRQAQDNKQPSSPQANPHFSLAASPLAGRTGFVYAGNMGVAQGMDSVDALLEHFSSDPKVGFLLVGRGSEVGKIEEKIRAKAWSHVLLLDEVAPDEMHGILSQCHISLIFLDARHQTHNIPGKLISYLKAGLPVLAYVNPGNDLETLIPDAGIGRVCSGGGAMSHHGLFEAAHAVLQDSLDPRIKERVTAFGQNRFSVAKAAEQITHQFAAKQ
jgi:glycosyltransferase involved in cell wall biosynthesis